MEERKIALEKEKAKAEHQRWLADQELKKVQLQREDERLKDEAVQAKKFGDAMRGSMVHMGPDPIDAVAFFQRAKQLFADYGVPETFKANLIWPFLNQKAKQMLARLTTDVSSKYSSLKDEILREMKLSAANYLQRFNTTVKSDDETFVAYASRLQGLLSYYLESRKVSKFDELCELLVCDRLKSVLPENCLKYVLSIESGHDKRWLPLKNLTDRSTVL